MGQAPRRFLLDADLDGLEALRGLVQVDRQTARRAIERLRERLPDDPDLEALTAAIEDLQRLLVAAIDARTGELIDESV